MNGKQYIERDVTPHLQKLMRSYPVVTICGPRQSGKTTLARHMYPEYDYVSLENYNERQRFYDDPVGFLALHPAPCIFDEVQNTPELLSYLQGIVDEKDTPGMYILTGSVQMELQEKVTQSLAGRTGFVDLLPLSLHELQQAGISLSRDEYMLLGGLPRVHVQQIDPVNAYSDYFRSYVERDIRQLVNIRNLSEFELFVRLLAARVGQVVNLSAMAGEVGVSSTTLREWLTLLEASYIVFTLHPYYKNFGKRLTKTPKIYFTEPGLVASLLGIETPAQMGRDPLVGNMFENLVVLEALKSRFNAGRRSNLYFFRDTKGFEIDLILDEQRLPRPVEIKSTHTYDSNLTRNVRQFEFMLPDALTPHLVYAGAPMGCVQGVKVESYLNMYHVVNG
ncbi:MAG: ATP-binding protein [Akkermansia sp.]|nr:ATP-binding protein [Akkermansia sp.]